MSEENSRISVEENKQEQAVKSTEGKRLQESGGKRSGGKLALLIAGITAGVLVAACAAVCGVAATRDTVLRGTHLLGADVGGMTRAQVQEMWEKDGDAICDETRITLLKDGEALREVSLRELAVSVRPEDAAQDAWQAGHGGNFLTNGWRFVRSWFEETEVEPRLTVDEAGLTAAAEALCQELDIPAVDGAYRLDKEKADSLYVTRPMDGLQIDGEALCQNVKQAAETGDLSPIECRYEVLSAKPIDLDEVYENIHGEMTNAGYDKYTGELTDGKIGVEFDVTQAKGLLKEAQPGQEFTVPAKVTFPRVTKEELKDLLFRDCLGSYTTYASGSSNRLFNVQRAAGMISGTVLNSGETFSFNGVVGNTDEANGYLPAPGYMRGKTVDMFGGGVCQVSSTLYYATLLSNLEIVTRFCHQYVPAYITWGCDATVNDGWPDYCFRNDTDYPIKIVTNYSNDYLTVSIYGTKLDDTYVQMISETLSSTPSHEEFEEDEKLKPGEKVLEQSGYTGYHVRTWRNVYAGDGTLISSVVEDDSHYDMRPTIYRVGPEKPKEETKPDPTPASEPGDGEGD